MIKTSTGYITTGDHSTLTLICNNLLLDNEIHPFQDDLITRNINLYKNSLGIEHILNEYNIYYKILEEYNFNKNYVKCEFRYRFNDAKRLSIFLKLTEDC